ncbi:hypothetical protein L1987_48370 [Smallanthus sonchifolius]|uniref:Uncharacterized protein n=1 Tax=Smallanthus sonchifolius TaxID=185202 RepID=A0ACB9FRG4_9ASTR|nr:hypothetical protein L1987_48370 [Smallanthus sonchifolius]
MLTEFRFFSFDEFVLVLGGIGPAGHSTDDLYVIDLTNDKYKWHSIRPIICLNLPSFSGGLNPWGIPSRRRHPVEHEEQAGGSEDEA